MGFKLKELKLNNLKVSYKLLLLYIICVLGPIVFTNIFFINSILSNVREREMNALNSSVEKIVLELKKSVDDVLYMSNTILADSTLYDTLETKYAGVYDFYPVYNEFLRNYIARNLPVYKQVSAMTFYTSNDTIPNSNGYIYIDEEVKSREWFRKLDQTPAKSIVVSHIENGTHTLSLIQRLDQYTHKNNFVKIVKIDFRVQALNEILKREAFEGDLYIVNEDREIILSTVTDYNGGQFGAFPRFSDIKMSNGKSIIQKNIANTLSLREWNVIGVYNDEILKGIIYESAIFIIVLASVSLLIATLITYWISRSFNKRLKIIGKFMNRLGNQNFDIINIDEGRDEIGELIRTFNKMSMQIKQLIQNEYESNLQRKNLEIERKQAQINALQSQINPHFLFNTLECIKMRSMMKKETETAQIIMYLSKAFRRMLVWEKDLVTVGDEIAYIEDFLKIQKYRFDDKIDYHIQVEDEVVNYKIPKMTLQPFVENASIHGIEGIKGKGEIRLEIHKVDGTLECIISDNGAGISLEHLNRILDGIRNEEQTHKSVGMRNVYKRLKLFYGDDVYFNIESWESGGTRIVIRVPADKANNSAVEEGVDVQSIDRR